jgi:hypothetical protein
MRKRLRLLQLRAVGQEPSSPVQERSSAPRRRVAIEEEEEDGKETGDVDLVDETVVPLQAYMSAMDEQLRAAGVKAALPTHTNSSVRPEDSEDALLLASVLKSCELEAEGGVPGPASSLLSSLGLSLPQPSLET